MDIDEVYFKGSDEVLIFSIISQVDVQNSRGTCNF